MPGTGPITKCREHLHKVDESYGAHFQVASTTGFAMIGAGVACILHAVVPAVFPDRASETIRQLNARMAKRHSAKAKDAFPPLEYEI